MPKERFRKENSGEIEGGSLHEFVNLLAPRRVAWRVILQPRVVGDGVTSSCMMPGTDALSPHEANGPAIMPLSCVCMDTSARTTARAETDEGHGKAEQVGKQGEEKKNIYGHDRHD